MKIKTARFAELDVDEKDVIYFKEGPLNFEQLRRFIIVDPGDKTLILWLQSIENPKIAFPIVEPRIFCSDYTVKLLPMELISLDLENLKDAGIYTILTIPQVVTEMTANLKAPIIINSKTRQARQIVLQDNRLVPNHPMYNEFKAYISKRVSDDSSPRHRNVAPTFSPRSGPGLSP